jgi:DNA polymerase-4
MLGPSIEKKLTQVGIMTLGQLAALPDGALEGLFGRQGPILGQRARGMDPTPVGFGDVAAKSISREGTFAMDVADPAHLRAVLRGFSESVGAELRRGGRRARTASVKVRYEDFSTVGRSVTLPQPFNSDDAIFAAAETLLDKVRAGDRRPVRLVGVGVSNLVADAVQLSLEPAPARRQESLSATIDRVRRKYGVHSLETGRTAFDAATRDQDGVFERGTGLSSQIK